MCHLVAEVVLRGSGWVTVAREMEEPRVLVPKRVKRPSKFGSVPQCNSVGTAPSIRMEPCSENRETCHQIHARLQPSF